MLGVATAVAVLAGALLVGDSVRASLRELALQRLGQTDRVITSTGFFRDQLANDLQSDSQFAIAGFAETCPLIALEGTVTHEPSKRVASRIKVYGVDERFLKFHHLLDKQPPRNREVFLSAGLARELSATTGDALVLRVEKPSAIPVESLHSRKEDLGSTLRLTVQETLPPDSVGEFSLQPQQGEVRAVFVALSSLQRGIDQPGKANLILISESSRDVTAPAAVAAKDEALMRILKARTSLDDYGIKLRTVGSPASQPGISLEQESKVISGPLSKVADETANALSLHRLPVLSYLANSISAGERSIPYSLVTGLDESGLELLAPGQARKPDDIILNEWAARELGARPGDPVSLDYYVWHEAGELETKTARFHLAAVVPINGLAADKDLVPEYPGITGSEHLADWDPPFPVDLKRIRKQDEDYWDQYRTTPKAFIPLATAQELWQTRFGKLTSLRLIAAGNASPEATLDSFQQRLRAALDPATMGFTVLPVRTQALEASRGATDFGEYFLYFSFFLVISALMLSALFFRLGIEQRLREIGLLQAVGFPAAKIRKLFLAEGLLLAIIGSLLGLAGAVGYGQFVIVGLRTWWVDAVGTTMLRLHVSPLSLGLGAAGGVIAALLCIVWTLRGLGKESTRTLLSGIRGNAGQTVKHGDGISGTTGRLSHLLNFSSQRVGTVLVILALALLIAAALQQR